MKRARRGREGGLARRLVAGLVLCGACVSCAGSGDAGKPTAVLSPSIAAESEQRRLITSWSRASRAERLALEPALVKFWEGHPDDALSRMVEALLAWIQLEKGDPRVAEVRARHVKAVAGPGTVSDVATTVEGAALRRQGKPDQALALLEPLVSKLIDPWARGFYNQEVVDSAVEAGHFRRALPLMRVWLREAAPEERASVRAHVEQSLERVPPRALTALLDEPAPALATEEEMELRKLAAQRLAFVARESKDAELSQHLLNTAGALLGDQADAVAHIATVASRARVEARTVGLVLSLQNDKTRRRGADIVAGVTFGLGLPGSGARLVSRDDHGSADRFEEVLAALSADGASVVIAGSDEKEATIAAAFAESHHIPVLLLRPPAPTPTPPAADSKPRFSFVVGADPAELETALVIALATRGAAPVAILADQPGRPRPALAQVAAVRGCDEAGAPWKSLGAAGLVLAADADCAREALAAAAPLRIRFAAGFESSALPLPAGSVITTAGTFPFPPAGKTSPPALVRWRDEHAGPPSWWAALGRDAAVLAWAAVKELPAQGTEEPAEVEARRAQVASALARATIRRDDPLWTTDASGFGGARVLPRTLAIREVTAPTRP